MTLINFCQNNSTNFFTIFNSNFNRGMKYTFTIFTILIQYVTIITDLYSLRYSKYDVRECNNNQDYNHGNSVSICRRAVIISGKCMYNDALLQHADREQ